MRPFHLSPSEQRGYFILFLGLIALLLVRSLPAKRTFYDVSVYMDKLPSGPGRFTSRTDTSGVIRVKKFEKNIRSRVAPQFPEHFDPNYLSAREMYKLHFPEIWIDRILQFKRDDGYIENESDFLRLCADDTGMYQALRPHLRFRHAPMRREHPVTPISTTDLNLAGESDLTAIRGIGAVLASRILKFRDALGGFVSPDQLFEVYGLDSTVVVKVLDKFELISEVHLININEAGLKELRAHPYISHQMAGLLVKYRNVHGAFSAVTELHELYSWKPDAIEKLLPYLTTGDQPGL